MPVLCRAMRKRPGRKRKPYLNMAHHAVADVVEHIRAKRWTARPVTDAYASANYVEALVQLADDTDWLAREVPLPDHPAPRHPPVYYTMYPGTGLPKPVKDSYLRGDYVYKSDGSRVTQAEIIPPWISAKSYPEPSMEDVMSLEWKVCYTLSYWSDKAQVIIHWYEKMGRTSVFSSIPLTDLVFRPGRPV